MTLITLRMNLQRSGAAKSRNKYSAVKIITQAVSKQKKAVSYRSPQGGFLSVPGMRPQGTVSTMLAITEKAMKKPVT